MTLKKILPLVAVVALVLPASAMAAPKPKIQFSQAAYAVAENGGAATVTVVRQGNAKRVNQAVTVDYATSDGTAKAGTDYTAAHGTISFASGETSKTFSVPVIDNAIVDGPRTVNLKLSRPTGSGTRALLGYPSSATLVIADNDTSNPGGGGTPTSSFQLAAATDIVSESAGTETLFIIRSGDLSQSATVNFASADGTALSGTDYTGVSGSRTFPAQGADTTDPAPIIQSVPVTLLHNLSTTPPTRDFSFALSIPAGSSSTLASPSTETVTIVNMDGTPSLQWSSAAYSAGENAGSVRLTVFAAGNVGSEVDVDYATADGSARAGVNYTQQNDTLQFLTGDVAESFDVSVNADGQLGDRYFTTALTNATGGGVVGTPDTTTVTVLNTDGPPAGTGNPGGSGDTAQGTSGAAQTGGEQFVLGARQAACGLVVKAVKTQKLLKQKGLKLTLRAGQACKVSLGTTIKQLVSKKKKAQIVRALSFKGQKAALTLQPGKAKTVTVKFTKKTLKAITKALKAHKKLVATVVVTERDSASKIKYRTLKITIRR